VRHSLLPPIVEFGTAARLLDDAADAFLKRDFVAARELVEQANIPEISVHANKVVGKMTSEVHRNTRRPKCLPKEERDPTRMPSRKEQNAIFQRDGWRCRFCNIRVISKEARSVICKAFLIESKWTSLNQQRHSSLYAMASSLDHVHPHGRGGKNTVENFVTACYCCQFGRGEWTLSEVGISDPRERPPIVDSWDGLSRIIQKPHK